LNIFILDKNLIKSAQYHTNKHVVKMLTESCQIMCTVYRETTKEKNIPEIIYKSTHLKHPCVLWCKESYDNFLYCLKLAKALYSEYQYRYNQPKKHQRNLKIIKYFMSCKLNLSLEKSITSFALAMPYQYKLEVIKKKGRWGTVHWEIKGLNKEDYQSINSKTFDSEKEAQIYATIQSYRNYYMNEKKHLFKWTKRETPYWIKERRLKNHGITFSI